ncbi:hypothetical protein U0070_008198 [Myodes glareolus]|uniref:Uncharacterized protein n=1 Tax=Myodes glareolus TaxID=447135 RepID=A0AAW0HM17_MYOGA
MPPLRQREWKGNQEPLHLTLAVLDILQKPPSYEEHKDFPLPTSVQNPLGTSTTSTHAFHHIMGWQSSREEPEALPRDRQLTKSIENMIKVYREFETTVKSLKSSEAQGGTFRVLDVECKHEENW